MTLPVHMGFNFLRLALHASGVRWLRVLWFVSRSFTPFIQLLHCSMPAVQMWALWGMLHVCHRNGMQVSIVTKYNPQVSLELQCGVGISALLIQNARVPKELVWVTPILACERRLTTFWNFFIVPEVSAAQLLSFKWSRCRIFAGSSGGSRPSDKLGAGLQNKFFRPFGPQFGL